MQPLLLLLSLLVLLVGGSKTSVVSKAVAPQAMMRPWRR